MNAIIVLCHFCEIHGPKPIFCTQTLRNTKLKSSIYIQEQQQQEQQENCPGCYPIGLTHLLYSNDKESDATFVSSPLPVLPEVRILVSQAAIRSLSCEVNFNKDEGFVFFGDTTRGHTLSHTFHVWDNKARGFYQLFSIIILMKDKYTLLNMKPFLAQNLRKISNDLQQYAKCQQAEQQRESSEGIHLKKRCDDLTSDSQLQIQRPLIELTGEGNIYTLIHSHFAWLLLAATRYLTEHIAFSNLPWLSLKHQSEQCVTPDPNGFRIHKWPQEAENLYNIASDNDDDNKSLRYIKQILGADQLPIICYCALTGIQIILRGESTKTFHLVTCLKKLLPPVMHRLIKINAEHEQSLKSQYKIISLTSEIAVPKPNVFIYRIDFTGNTLNDNNISIKWPGTMPAKWPNLLTKLMKAVEETRFTDTILNCRTKILVEEWKNKVICIMCTKNSNSQMKLKKMLGVQSQDEALINYWSTNLMR